MLASWLVSTQMNRRFREYAQIPIQLTGREVAERMLRENGITDVKVMSVPGQLTDHYDPRNKTVNLSEPVYAMNSVAAAAVAAHECGHAVQHAQAYAWLTMRSKLVPVVQLSSGLMPWLLMGGLVMMMATKSPILLAIGVAAYAATTAFAFITLPVEFDASKRAMVWMGKSGLASSMHQDRAKNALFWAAMTYVVAALASLAQLLYWVMILLNRR
jgi:Zn-dependent membrane protease YugP